MSLHWKGMGMSLPPNSCYNTAIGSLTKAFSVMQTNSMRIIVSTIPLGRPHKVTYSVPIYWRALWL